MRGNAELHVAVGVITNEAGEVLITRRREHLHQGGLWEFPGGKLEPGETVRDALVRELREELAISVQDASPLLKIRHAYPEYNVILDVWRVHGFGGNPTGVEDQPVRWMAPEDLTQCEFPPANRAIVAAVRLPDRYAICDDEVGDSAVLLQKLRQLVERGLRLIQLRAKQLDASRYRKVAEAASDYCRSQGIALLLNCGPELAAPMGAAGIHLSSANLMKLSERPLGPDAWVAASCHNLEELRQAERIGADFVVLSPVLATASHPSAPAMGWSRFGRLVDKANLPVFALGGMQPWHLSEAKYHGAQGIAAIRGFCAG